MDYTAFKARALEINKEVSDTSVSTQGNEDTIKHMLGVVDSSNEPERNSETDNTVDPVEPEVFSMPAPDSWVDGIEGVWDNSKKDVNIDGYIKLYDKNNANSGVIFIKLVHKPYYSENNIDNEMYSRLPSSALVWYLNGNRNNNNIYPTTDATSITVESTGEVIDFVHNQRIYGWTQPSLDMWRNYAPSSINEVLELAYFDTTGLQVRRNSVSTQTRLGLIEVFKGTN